LTTLTRFALVEIHRKVFQKYVGALGLSAVSVTMPSVQPWPLMPFAYSGG
jgi:hypothetical protein